MWMLAYNRLEGERTGKMSSTGDLQPVRDGYTGPVEVEGDDSYIGKSIVAIESMALSMTTQDMPQSTVMLCQLTLCTCIILTLASDFRSVLREERGVLTRAGYQKPV